MLAVYESVVAGPVVAGCASLIVLLTEQDKFLQIWLHSCEMVGVTARKSYMVTCMGESL